MLRCKDDCCGQDKLIHASSKQALKAELSGLNTPEFQCSELSELSSSSFFRDNQRFAEAGQGVIDGFNSKKRCDVSTTITY